ncbi:hypothetical protein VaNZ11_004150 [Volvox africanus]|uniref:Ankyrin repeat protein n=1 Tax=Volvox africanus TaxID=51714 RepID=A0ABQ5RXE5_9CHLO|nr:hypothetical protein VaNZ11_004150 [Volvox africanus]
MGNILSPEAGPLFDAIAEGNVDAAVKALEAHPRLSHARAGKKNRTLYHACASSGQVKVLKRLCEHVWQTIPDELGKIHSESTPEGRFHPAIYRAMNTYDETGLTPLMLACRKGHADAVLHLLSQGADPWLGDRLLARSALHFAARANQPACIEAILNSPFVELTGRVRSKECKLVDYPSSSGYTPLHYAAGSRAADAASALFRHGASPNAKTFDMGFDFIQLDRGSTPLHAAARFQNLDLAMQLLKHWDENLRHLDVTDPRVVDNHERIKPYQMPGVKMNKALARVLDPDTPIREISDPFGETSRPNSVPVVKVTPSRSATAPLSHSQVMAGPLLASRESDISSPGSGRGSGGKTPAGWEGPNTAGGERFTVYQCAEFEANCDSAAQVPAVPPHADAAIKWVSTGLGLHRSQSDGRRVVLGQGASVNGLSRTRSGAAIPAPSDRFSSYRRNSFGDSDGERGQDCRTCPAVGAPAVVATATMDKSAAGPVAPNGVMSLPPYKSPFMFGTPAVTASGAGRGPVSECQLPSPGGRGQLLTHTRGDLAAAGGLTKTRSREGGADAAAEVTGARGGLACPANDGPQRSAEPSSQASSNSTAGGNPVSRSSSQKLSGGTHTTTSSTIPAADPAVPALKPSLSRTLSSSRRGSSPTSRDVDAPPPVFSAWSDTTSTTSTTPLVVAGITVSSRKTVMKDKPAAVPDFSRDSHSEGRQPPVEVTMYPHRLVSVEPLKAGEAGESGDARTVTMKAGATGTTHRITHHDRKVPHITHHHQHHHQQRQCKGGTDFGLHAVNQSLGSLSLSLSLSRRGLMPTVELSEDESRMEDRGAAVKALSPGASRRSRAMT